ncbi:hypothetical protein FQN49_006785, partial [Arthroderma sp. PD_2]
MAFSLLCSTNSTLNCSELQCRTGLVLLICCLLSLLILAISYFRYRRKRDHLYTLFNPAFAREEEPEVLVKARAAASPVQAIIEGLLLLVDFVLALLLLLLHHEAQDDCPLKFTSAVSSVYLLVLLVGRSYGAKLGLPWHSVCLYAAQWLYTLLLAHITVFQQHPDRFSVVAVSSRLAIFTLLGLVHCLTPRKPPQTLGLEGDPPGRDEIASLLSRLTFSWMDQLVWAAFRKKTLHLEDLGVLNRQYAAATVLPWFQRLSNPSQSLLQRIFFAFKYSILWQGMWAAVNSVAVFVPPILIRVILQYLESTDETPAHIAWAYVGGLLLFGLLATLAE